MGPIHAQHRASRTADGDSPALLLERALAAELAGDNETRAKLLEQAIAADDDFAAAHWHAGHVAAGRRWLTPEEVKNATSRDERYAQYRTFRSRLLGQFAGLEEHVALARWCARQGLIDEARYHWYRVLQIEPQHVEGLAALGAVWRAGQLVPRDEIQRLAKDERRLRITTRQWQDRLEDWTESIERREDDAAAAHAAAVKFRAIDDPDAIMPLAEVLAASDGEVAGLAIAALGEMTDHRATVVLLHAAVLLPDEHVRTAAAEQLRRRPMHDWVPQLLASMEKPLESWFRVTVSPQGHVVYHHELYREGAAHNKVFNSLATFEQQDVAGASTFVKSIRFGDHFRRATPDEERRKATAKTQNAADAFGSYAAQAQSVESEVARANEWTLLVNERIRQLLTPIVEQDLGDDPKSWWDWWVDYNEVYLDGEKPTVELHASAHKSISLIPTVWMSCFQRGTKVHTKTGLVPIEQIVAGDMVLAQDVATGQLAYKPVLKTTIRPPCAMLRLTIDGETIVTTRGHPFWASGSGWRMAKLLESGQLLHGLDGSFPLEAIDELPEDQAHNLVVGDFSTYFVGERGILVHDNTFRRPTTVVLPGLHRRTLSAK